MKSSALSNGENRIALQQLLQNRKLRHLWRHNLGSYNNNSNNNKTGSPSLTILLITVATLMHLQIIVYLILTKTGNDSHILINGLHWKNINLFRLKAKLQQRRTNPLSSSGIIHNLPMVSLWTVRVCRSTIGYAPNKLPPIRSPRGCLAVRHECQPCRHHIARWRRSTSQTGRCLHNILPFE